MNKGQVRAHIAKREAEHIKKEHPKFALDDSQNVLRTVREATKD